MVQTKTPKQIDVHVRKLQKEITQLRALKKGLQKVKKISMAVTRIEHPKKGKKKSTKRKASKKKVTRKKTTKKKKR